VERKGIKRPDNEWEVDFTSAHVRAEKARKEGRHNFALLTVRIHNAPGSELVPMVHWLVPGAPLGTTFYPLPDGAGWGLRRPCARGTFRIDDVSRLPFQITPIETV
jgi:hypothetical protein